MGKMKNLINHIILGDCLEIMKDIEDNSIDMILCDLPYNITRLKLDILIPFEPLWKHYERIIKDNGAICLFGQDKFTANMIVFKQGLHRYNLIWKKGNRVTGFLNSKRMPLKNHEDIMVFYKKLPVYNPQFRIGGSQHAQGKSSVGNNRWSKGLYGEAKNNDFVDYRKGSKEKYPISILDFEKPHPQLKPFQKPIKLCEYLIKMYTNEGMLVLDNAIGTGTTAIAARNLNRNWIGIEKDKEIFKIAKDRVEGSEREKDLFDEFGFKI